jgi:hypothetical protein
LQEATQQVLHNKTPGHHRVVLNGDHWASGLYFLRWEAGGVSQVKKVVMLK